MIKDLVARTWRLALTVGPLVAIALTPGGRPQVALT